MPTDPSKPWDYFHINAVNPDTDGNLLVDGRGTSTVYKVSHKTGNVIWHLGGKSSDFQLGPGVQFNGQHNPLPETGQPNTYRIFDNGNGGGPATGKPSRVIDVKIDTAAKTATLVKSIEHPDGVIANSQGGLAAPRQRRRVRRLGQRRPPLRVRQRRQPAVGRPGTDRLRQLPGLPIPVGRATTDRPHHRGVPYRPDPRRRRRDLERRHRGRPLGRPLGPQLAPPAPGRPRRLGRAVHRYAGSHRRPLRRDRRP